MKNFIKSEDVQIEQIGDGLRRQIMAYDSNLMLTKIYFDKGAVGAPHKHPHQQVTYVMQGAFEVEISGEKQILKQGDAFLIPQNAVHGVMCLEEGILIDTFSPLREDFL